VSKATQAVQFVLMVSPVDGDAAADPLGSTDAAVVGATLGAVVAVPVPVHAANRMAAVAPSDSSLKELRNVNSSSTTAVRDGGPRPSVREDTLSHERRR
jgi:hypothetical protein